MASPVSLEVGDGFARVALNRPERRNALSLETVSALQETLDGTAADPSIHAVLLEGKGRAFCAGMDLKAVRLDAPDEAERFARALARVYRTLMLSPVPLLCAVDAPVSGGGMGLVGAADLVWAGPDARFSLPETSLGLVPALVSVVLKRRLAPKSLVGMAVAGVSFDAQGAVAAGLSDFAAPGRASEAAEGFLRGMLRARSPAAMRRTKRFLERRAEEGIDQELEEALAEFRESVATEDARRGLSAFLRKESVRWNED